MMRITQKRNKLRIRGGGGSPKKRKPELTGEERQFRNDLTVFGDLIKETFNSIGERILDIIGTKEAAAKDKKELVGKQRETAKKIKNFFYESSSKKGNIVTTIAMMRDNFGRYHSTYKQVFVKKLMKYMKKLEENKLFNLPNLGIEEEPVNFYELFATEFRLHTGEILPGKNTLEISDDTDQEDNEIAQVRRELDICREQLSACNKQLELVTTELQTNYRTCISNGVSSGANPPKTKNKKDNNNAKTRKADTQKNQTHNFTENELFNKILRLKFGKPRAQKLNKGQITPNRAEPTVLYGPQRLSNENFIDLERKIDELYNDNNNNKDYYNELMKWINTQTDKLKKSKGEEVELNIGDWTPSVQRQFEEHVNRLHKAYLHRLMMQEHIQMFGENYEIPNEDAAENPTLQAINTIQPNAVTNNTINDEHNSDNSDVPSVRDDMFEDPDEDDDDDLPFVPSQIVALKEDFKYLNNERRNKAIAFIKSKNLPENNIELWNPQIQRDYRYFITSLLKEQEDEEDKKKAERKKREASAAAAAQAANANQFFDGEDDDEEEYGYYDGGRNRKSKRKQKRRNAKKTQQKRLKK